MTTPTHRPSVSVVLVGDDGEELIAHQPQTSPVVREVVRDSGHWLSERVDHARDYRANPGPRLGGGADQIRRRGTSEEVQTPLALRPQEALRLASAGSLMAEDIGAISVDTSTCRSERTTQGLGRLSWTVSVRTGHVMRRRASLRLRPSPSNRLTIVELVPERARWFRTGAFVRAGVPAVRELCDRIRVAAATT